MIKGLETEKVPTDGHSKLQCAAKTYCVQQYFNQGIHYKNGQFSFLYSAQI